MKTGKSPILKHLYPVENFVDEKHGPRNPAAPASRWGYFGTVGTFLNLCF